MRKLLLCLGLITVLCSPLLAAGDKGVDPSAPDPAALPDMTWEKRDMKAIVRVFKTPIILSATDDPDMNVKFRHTDHRGPNCALCHHKVTSTGERLVSCSTAPDCHVLTGKSSDPKSLFQAFHSKDSERSCYACHLEKRALFKDVKGCTSCHKQLVEK